MTVNPRRTVLMVLIALGVQLNGLALQLSEPCAKNCSITMQHVVTISDAGHPGILPEEAINVFRSVNGSYLVASRDLKQLLVVNAAGMIVRLVQGPAEHPFRLISNLLPGPAGAVLAYDYFGHSLTTISKDFVATNVAPCQYRPSIILSDGRFVLAEQVNTKERIGQPLHLLDEHCLIDASFGSETGMYRAGQPFRYDRVVAPSEKGMLWAAAPGRYVLERWNPTTRTKLSTVEVKSDWFQESAEPEKLRSRPKPFIDALWESSGYMWVLLRDADTNWVAPPPTTGEPPPQRGDNERSYDSVLEAVSIRTGQVIASRRFDMPLDGRGGTFLLSSVKRIAPGRDQIDVWRPQLVRRTK